MKKYYRRKKVSKYVIVFIELDHVDTSHWEVNIHTEQPKTLIGGKNYSQRIIALDNYRKLNSVRNIKKWLNNEAIEVRS